MFRAVIIDDEESSIEMLKILASRYSAAIRVVASTLSPEEGISLIEDYRPDVVFLDISMPFLNGFELLSRLSFRHFKLVFTTAHREYAIKAIKQKAFDYLLKPVDEDDFRVCLETLKKEREEMAGEGKINLQPVIEIQVKDGINYIRQKEIIRLEASRNYTVFYLDSGQRQVASKTLGEFESRLDRDLFYRCHKSHIVNLQKVQKFINHNGFFALMVDGSLPDVSKNNKELFLELLKKI